MGSQGSFSRRGVEFVVVAAVAGFFVCFVFMSHSDINKRLTKRCE